MKKVLSLALVFVLMFTVCVPVFAASVGSTPVTNYLIKEDKI